MVFETTIPIEEVRRSMDCHQYVAVCPTGVVNGYGKRLDGRVMP